MSQSRDLPLDSHLHTDLSPDSNVPIDIYAAQAAERGIAEIAITDHVDFDRRDPAYRFSSFGDRERVAREAADRWAGRGVAIRFGVELTYNRTWEHEIRDHLARHTYDFTIGSVHDWPGSPYRDRQAIDAWVVGLSDAEMVAPYVAEVLGAARSGLFDTVGHLDVVKKYLSGHVPAARLTVAPELYEEVVRALVESGTALEVNTSGLRQGPRDTYPTAAIVAMFRDLGGAAVTAGSDAHRAETFAFGLEDGYRLLAKAGFEELAFRRGGPRVGVPIPGGREWS